MSNLEYIAVNVFNGEGYTQPTIEKIKKGDWLPFVCGEYEGYFKAANFNCNGFERVEFTYNCGDNKAALELIKKPDNKVALVSLDVYSCGVSVSLFDSYEEAKSKLKNIVLDEDTEWFDKIDVEGFVEVWPDHFSSHHDDGFHYCQIIC